MSDVPRKGVTIPMSNDSLAIPRRRPVPVRPFSVFLSIGLLLAGSIVVGAVQSKADAGRTVWDAVYTDAQAARGEGAYREQCAACHLDSLGGADMAPGLTGDIFQSTWDGLTVGALFERIRLSMPQDAPASLSAQTYADIVAFMLKVNKFPAGPNEMEPDRVALEAITFVKQAEPRQ